MKRIANSCAAAFTLLEVMIAVAFIGIALLALLSLHHSNLQSVIRGQDLTRAAMLAQALMSQAELERFPAAGTSNGNFSQYPGDYRNFQWQRSVEQLPNFPDMCRVQIRILYGPGLHRTFSLTEFMHNPAPPPPPNGSNSPPPDLSQNPAAQGGAGQ
jgi:type II secretion system protein I